MGHRRVELCILSLASSFARIASSHTVTSFRSVEGDNKDRIGGYNSNDWRV